MRILGPWPIRPERFKSQVQCVACGVSSVRAEPMISVTSGFKPVTEILRPDCGITFMLFIRSLQVDCERTAHVLPSVQGPQGLANQRERFEEGATSINSEMISLDQGILSVSWKGGGERPPPPQFQFY